ncbi:MAG: phosphoribosyl transferase [Candidatus Colwellbacteria bacterium]|nr:phosphoribosyl transferase [Candidatus Colwellbacteria bacterium]
MRFRDRTEAGQLLVQHLGHYEGKEVVIYALPRGGVVLGFEIAKALNAPLDLIITRKIGHPLNPEYAICAVAEDGDLICNEAERAAVDPAWFSKEVEKERAEARRRREIYLGKRKTPEVRGKIAILVDDGIATGLTLELAIKELKHKEPAKIIVAVPVAPRDAAREIEKEVDEFVALDIPALYLGAVGAYYDDFPQVTDEEVIEMLDRARP